MKEIVKRYIPIILIIVIIVSLVSVFGIYFLLFRKKKEKKDKDTSNHNLYIALKITGSGVVTEYYNQLEDERICNGVLNIIYGKDADGGLNTIYENIMGRKIDLQTFSCSGKTFKEINTSIQIINMYMNNMVFTILKNKDVKKRNNDLVSIFVITINGLMSLFIPKDKFSFIVDRDRDNKIQIQITVKATGFDGINPVQDLIYSPSTIIKDIDNISNNPNYFPSDTLDMRRSTIAIALPLVNKKDIMSLRSDTDPKLTIDKLATCLIYSLAKNGIIYN